MPASIRRQLLGDQARRFERNDIHRMLPRAVTDRYTNHVFDLRSLRYFRLICDSSLLILLREVASQEFWPAPQVGSQTPTFYGDRR